MIVGLTGSIAMGKSTTTEMFEKLGYPVFDADKEVHKLYSNGGKAALEISLLFPDVIKKGAVDRTALAAKIAKNPKMLPQIEKIVHPMVEAAEKHFIAKQRKAGAELIIMDIPLLFEADRSKDVDVIVVVSASKKRQRQRALQRPDMTPEKLDLILSRQLPDEEKRARADFVIDTDRSFEDTLEQVKKLVKKLTFSNDLRRV